MQPKRGFIRNEPFPGTGSDCTTVQPDFEPEEESESESKREPTYEELRARLHELELEAASVQPEFTFETGRPRFYCLRTESGIRGLCPPPFSCASRLVGFASAWHRYKPVFVWVQYCARRNLPGIDKFLLRSFLDSGKEEPLETRRPERRTSECIATGTCIALEDQSPLVLFRRLSEASR